MFSLTLFAICSRIITNSPLTATNCHELTSPHTTTRLFRYGNLFEFGWEVAKSWPNKTVDCSKAATNGHPQQQLLCHSQQLLRDKYGAALLYKSAAGGASSDLVCGGLDGSCIMDPHPDLPYLEHVLDMARTSITKTPSSGVCIDRQVSDAIDLLGMHAWHHNRACPWPFF